MARPQKKTVIKKLGIGSIFAFERKDEGVSDENKQELWKVVGRPTKDGGRKNGKATYSVYCTYVKKNKDDQNTQPDKQFSLEYEVYEVRGKTKDWQAIDQRDQPKDKDGKPAVSPISTLASQVGAEVDDEDDEKDLEDLINEDEEEETDAD